MRPVNSIKALGLLLCLTSSSINSFAQQSVGIGTNTPNPRSVLQLVSPTQNQGFLLPKLTTSEINTMGLTPSDLGIMVYDSLLNQIRYWNGSAWLTVNTAVGGVTSIGTGTGLTGGPITTAGTISLSNSGVTAGTYGTASAVGSFSVDATGRITTAVDVPIALNASQITAGTLPLARGGTGAGTAATARTNLGLGTMALQNATAVTITGGTISGLTTPLGVGSGGTGTNSVTLNGVAYGGAGLINYTAAGTSGQILQVNGSGQPEFVSPNTIGWGLTGNAGTNSLTNFVGTTDNNDFVLRANNTEVMRLKANNKVNIGFSGSGLHALNVFGANGATNSSASFSDGALSTFRIGHPANLVVAIGGNLDHTMQIGGFEANNASFTPRVTVLPSGNVGIGTTAPILNLEVLRESVGLFDLSLGGRVFSNNLSSSTDLILFRGRGTSLSPAALASGDELGNIFFQGQFGATSGNVAIGAAITSFSEGAWTASNVTPTMILFRTAGTTGGLTERMRITANGNVGIGTTTPNAPLQFASNLANRKIVLWDVSNNDHQYFGFGINPSTLRYQVDVPASNHIFFAGTSTTTSAELMRITGTGNVGIGTPSPSARLHTTGTVRFEGLTGGPGVVTSDALGNLSISPGASVTGSGATNKVAFWNTAGTIASTPNFHWDNTNQRLGIGTATPALPLDVVVNSSSIGLRSSFGSWDHLFFTVSPTDAVITAGGADAGLRFRVGNSAFGTYDGQPYTTVATMMPNGNVGIGTTNPLGRLHVENSDYGASSMILTSTAASAGATIRFTSPAVGGREYALIGSTGTGASTGAGFFGIFDNTGGAYRQVISPTGAIGFGVISPTQFFHINSNSPTTYQKWATSLTGNTGTDGFDIGITSAQNVELVQRENAAILLFTNNSERMRISNIGNVGIGTTAPSTRLDVVNSSLAAPSGRFYNGSTAFNSTGFTSGGLAFHSADVFAVGAVSTIAALPQSAGNFSSILSFHTAPNGSDQTIERMRIQANGNVGIGTSNPGTLRLAIVDAGNSNQYNGTFGVFANNLSQGVGIGFAGIQALGSNLNQDLSLNARGAGNITMQVSGTTGRVGIGTSLPFAKLDVTNDNLAARLINTSNTSVSDVLQISGGSNTVSGSWMIDFRRPDSNQIGLVFQNSANSVSYNTTSDLRLKTVLGSSRKGLNDLMNINIYDYRYKDDISGKTITGFLAQELYEIFPQSVTPPREGSENDPKANPWMVDYGSLSPLLIKAIQDQQKIIDNQSEIIKALEIRINSLEKK